MQIRYTIDMILNKPDVLAPLYKDNLILSPAEENDMTQIFLMGQDAWGAEYQTEEYLDICYNSDKYRSGNWFILKNCKGTPISSAISYAIPGLNNRSWIGIGSLSTAVDSRKKGYGLSCLPMLIEAHEKQKKYKDFILFQDIQTKTYNSAGFIAAESMGYTGLHPNLLLRTNKQNNQETELFLKNSVGYF